MVSGIGGFVFHGYERTFLLPVLGELFRMVWWCADSVRVGA